MMYLIGGAPRLGKSILAKKMLDGMGIPWLSSDVLCAMLKEGADMRFSDEMELATAQIVQNQLTAAHSITKPLRIFIERQIESQTDFTLEGVHLLPSLVSHFHKTRNTDVRSIFIVSTNKELVLSGLRSNTAEYDWMSDASEQMQHAMADFVVGYSTELKSQAEREGLFTFARTENFQQDVDAILRLLQ